MYTNVVPLLSAILGLVTVEIDSYHETVKESCIC